MSEAPTKTFYERVGGDEGVKKLVGRFYDLMDEWADAKHLRALHPTSLEESRVKLYEFLSGWLGGPGLYVEKRGHPRLRARHMPFRIDDDGAQMWMKCMSQALDDVVDDKDAVEKLKVGLAQLAAHMRNV